MKKTTTRQTNIELLRLLAMLSIVLMHAMNHGSVLDLAHSGEPNYYVGWSLFSLGMYSINIFLLISGYFMVNQHFHTMRMYKIFSQVFFYSVIIALLFWITGLAKPNVKDLVFCVLPISSDLYWYPSMYLGLVLLSPILNKLCHLLTRSQLLCTCVLGFALVSVWPNLAYFSSALNTAGGVSIVWFVCVYLFGAYIRLYYKPDGMVSKKLITSIGLVILLPVTRFLIEAMVATPLGRIPFLEDLLWGYSVFFQYSSILVTITSIVLFVTFLNIKIEKPFLSKTINAAAGASFGVYLIHDHMYIRDNMWEKLAIYNWLDDWYLLIASLGVVIGIYMICMMIELLRQKVFGLWERNDRFVSFFQRVDAKLYSYWSR